MRDRSAHTDRALELAQKLCDSVCNDDEMMQAAVWYAMDELGLDQAPEESEEFPDKLVYEAYWTKITEFHSQMVAMAGNMLSGLCLLRDKAGS